ncbi:MAG: stage V sporulation protein SpoVM [Ruminococcus sp.]|nr:stage V sporulation protein SpoVM [Ruminococcus sp.]
MKIVVVKNPRLLSGLFRVIFKIHKEMPEEER